MVYYNRCVSPLHSRACRGIGWGVDPAEEVSAGAARWGNDECKQLGTCLGTDIRDRDVLIVEDIIDTGHTLDYLMGALRARGPASLRVCCLLDKPTRREVPVPIDYLGFSIPDEWVFGYGLDLDESWRNLSLVATLKKEENDA